MSERLEQGAFYRGVPPGTVTVHWRGHAFPLPLSDDLRKHSTEVAWGYQGSGPSQLALALVRDATADTELAQRVYQEFKRRLIAEFDMDGSWEVRAIAVARIAYQIDQQTRQAWPQ